MAPVVLVGLGPTRATDKIRLPVCDSLRRLAHPAHVAADHTPPRGLAGLRELDPRVQMPKLAQNTCSVELHLAVRPQGRTFQTLIGVEQFDLAHATQQALGDLLLEPERCRGRLLPRTRGREWSRHADGLMLTAARRRCRRDVLALSRADPGRRESKC